MLATTSLNHRLFNKIAPASYDVMSTICQSRCPSSRLRHAFRLIPRFWSESASYDFASKICQTLSTDRNLTDLVGKGIVFDASADPGMLKRAEWIKFMSVFFNAEDRANRYFQRESEAGGSLRTNTRPTLCPDRLSPNDV